MTNIPRVAMVAALTVWTALASAKDANAVADLKAMHPDLNGDGGTVTLFEGSTRKSGQWSIGGRGELAEAGFSTTGTAEVHTYAPIVYVDNLGPFQTRAFANLWDGEVLTFHIDGASSDTVTRIKLGVRLSGSISHTLQIASGHAALDFCVGRAGTNLCDEPPAEVAALLNLPAPSGVARGTTGGIRYETGPHSFDDRMKAAIDVIGPDAVVPLWYLVQAHATSDPWVNQLSVDVQARARWTLTLPDGVSCTSRSGRAFKGQCPAASR